MLRHGRERWREAEEEVRFCNEKGVYIVSNMKNTSQIMAVYSHLVCMEKHRN